MATFGEMGTTGLQQWSGRIQQEFLVELQGQQGYKKYEEMRLNCGIVGALLLAIEQAIRGVTWTFTSDQGEDDPRLVILNDALNNMRHTFNDHVIEALTMLPFGFSIFEIVYERAEDGRVLWKKFAPRGQDTVLNWEFDNEGEVTGFVQQAPPTYQTKPLPVDKLILYRTRAERNNPEGRSILRTAYISYYFWKNLSEIEAIGLERYFAGLPVVTMPAGADPTESTDQNSDYGRAHKIVRNVRQDSQAGVVKPDGWGFELMSSGSQPPDTDTVINRYESRILMSALAQFLMLGQEGVGSLALSSNQGDFFTMSVNATADIIATTIIRHPAPRLLKQHGYDAAGIKLEHSPAGDIDLVGLADFLQKVGAMITWTPDDEAWLRGAGKLPEKTAEEIQAARDQKAAEQIEMAQATRPQPGTPQDEMGVELYASRSNAAVERDMDKLTRQTARTMADALAQMRARVMRGARKIR